MQPLNVACFQPVKHYHRKAIDHTVMLGATGFPVVEFFCIFKHIRKQAVKAETIKSAFRETGIYPINA
jgi:hypothetical protein